MFSKRDEKLQDNDHALVGQEVSDDAIDQFELPTDKVLDDIDLALGSATLREVSAEAANEKDEKNWDTISTDEKADALGDLSKSEVNESELLSNDEVYDDIDENTTDAPEKSQLPAVGISKGVFFSTILVLLSLTGLGFFYVLYTLNEVID